MNCNIIRRWTVAALLAFCTLTHALDKVHLHDGSSLSGKFVGASSTAIRIEIDGRVQALPIATVRTISFGEQRDSSKVAGDKITVEAGTTVEVRIETSVSSNSSRTGERFRAVLLTPIGTSEHTLARAGQVIWGRVIVAEPIRRDTTAGQLELELAEVEMLGRLRPLKSTVGVIVEAASSDVRHRRGELRVEAGSTLAFKLSQPIIIRPRR
jgi:hypothetical protein